MMLLYLYVKRQLKKCLKERYIAIILLSINHRHTDPRLFYIFRVFYFFLSILYFVLYIILLFSLLS